MATRAIDITAITCTRGHSGQYFTNANGRRECRQCKLENDHPDNRVQKSGTRGRKRKDPLAWMHAGVVDPTCSFDELNEEVLLFYRY
jgi:hypothetical protein